ncbi:MAG: hypothetical protein M3N68_14430 [Actinomycetota bacterium]|nr:hypothetical protein [Actinomycetota bacterium]
MAIVTLWFGVGLIVLGIVSYAGSGAESVTALIPAFFGIVLAALGFVGRREDRRALTMHIAALLALLGLLGSAGGLLSLPDLVTGEDLERPWAVAAQSVMALALAVYLALAVRSFVAARKARTS